MQPAAPHGGQGRKQKTEHPPSTLDKRRLICAQLDERYLRWLWIGWNNREQRLHTAVLRRTVDLIRQSRLESDAVVDVFESMNPCDWWHPPRLRKAFTSMVEMAPESASFFGNVIGGCAAVFPPELRGVRQLAQLGAAWRQAP